MNTTSLRLLGYSTIIAVAALLGGCVDATPTGPNRGPGYHQPVTPPTTAEQVRAVAGRSAAPQRAADLSACPKLQVEENSKLAFHVYAAGVQIYRWNGTTWSFVGPEATLSAEPEGNSVVGTHYAGPTWESNSGSKVVGAVVDRCTPNPNAIPWLLLRTVSAEGPGIFGRVTSIQRVNTAGGNPPSNPGTFTGEEARVPYTTEYFFYRTK